MLVATAVGLAAAVVLDVLRPVAFAPAIGLGVGANLAVLVAVLRGGPSGEEPVGPIS